MNEYIETQGSKIIDDKKNIENPILFTQMLLDFKGNMDKQISYCFNSDIKFEKGRDSSFQNFLNKSKHPPQFMAIFIDDFMTKQVSKLSGS